MEEKRLPRRMMFGELVGDTGYSGGQEDRMVRLEEDIKKTGVKFEGWRKAAQKASGWFQRVEEGRSCGNRMAQRAVELQSDTRRRRPRHLPSTPIRGGGRGRGSCPRD